MISHMVNDPHTTPTRDTCYTKTITLLQHMKTILEKLMMDSVTSLLENEYQGLSLLACMECIKNWLCIFVKREIELYAKVNVLSHDVTGKVFSTSLLSKASCWINLLQTSKRWVGERGDQL